MATPVKFYQSEKIPGKSMSEKLRLTLSMAQQLMADYQIESASKIRCRGDVLEISVDRSKLTPSQQRNSNDSHLYIKTGILVSLMESLIKSRGYRPQIRTFPRFDEPDLIAFVYIDGNVSSAVEDSRKNASAQAKADEELRKCAGRYGLKIFSVSDPGRQKQIVSTLKKPHDACGNNEPVSRFTLRSFREINSNEGEKIPEKNDLQVILSRQNSPNTWLNAGLFLGDILFKNENGADRPVYLPVSLESCPVLFRKYFSDAFPDVPGFPQFVLYRT